jgi:hypothetical protein
MVCVVYPPIVAKCIVRMEQFEEKYMERSDQQTKRMQMNGCWQQLGQCRRIRVFELYLWVCIFVWVSNWLVACLTGTGISTTFIQRNKFTLNHIERYLLAENATKFLYIRIVLVPKMYSCATII